MDKRRLTGALLDRLIHHVHIAHIEKISTVKSVEAAVELQTKYVKSAYEGYIAEATKIGEMYADLAKDAYKPYEAPIAKVAAAVKSATAA